MSLTLSGPPLWLLSPTVSAPGVVFSRLDGWPVHAFVNFKVGLTANRTYCGSFSLYRMTLSFTSRRYRSIVVSRVQGPRARCEPIPGMTESEAIHLAPERGRIGFAFTVCGRHVFAVCLRMVGDVAHWLKLSTEAFMRMFRRIGTFRGDSRGCTGSR